MQHICDSTSSSLSNPPESDCNAICRNTREMESELKALFLWCYVTENSAPCWALLTLRPTCKHTHAQWRSWLFLSFYWVLFLDTLSMCHFCVVCCLHTWRKTFVASMPRNVDRKYIDDLFYGIYAFQFWFYVFVSVFICLQLANKWAFVI